MKNAKFLYSFLLFQAILGNNRRIIVKSNGFVEITCRIHQSDVLRNSRLPTVANNGAGRKEKKHFQRFPKHRKCHAVLSSIVNQKKNLKNRSVPSLRVHDGGRGGIVIVRKNDPKEKSSEIVGKIKKNIIIIRMIIIAVTRGRETRV